MFVRSGAPQLHLEQKTTSVSKRTLLDRISPDLTAFCTSQVACHRQRLTMAAPLQAEPASALTSVLLQATTWPSAGSAPPATDKRPSWTFGVWTPAGSVATVRAHTPSGVLCAQQVQSVGSALAPGPARGAFVPSAIPPFQRFADLPAPVAPPPPVLSFPTASAWSFGADLHPRQQRLPHRLAHRP